MKIEERKSKGRSGAKKPSKGKKAAAEKDSVRVVVIGDENIGKTALIAGWMVR